MSIWKPNVLAVLASILLLQAMCPCGALAEEQPLKVFILAGQSNMVGHGKASELPAELKARQEMVRITLNGKGWAALAPRNEDSPAGLEYSFGQEMSAKLHEPIGIIKQAIGGTSLANDWNPEDPKSLYANLLAKVAAARQGRPVEIVGMCWMQGERDSKQQEWADAYGENLAKFIRRARKDFASPNMVFIAGRVNPPYPFAKTVRLAQEKCPLPGYAFVDCDKLSKIPPGELHYDTKGLVDLGRSFAVAMLHQMQQGRATTAPQ